MLAPWSDELARVTAAFEEPRLRPLLLSPAIEHDARQRTASAVVAALGVSAMVANLIAVLAERNRIALLPDVVRWYDSFLDDALDRARITIRSAAPLSTAERNELVELARRLTERREILASTEVDGDLLGGIVLDIGGTVYDGSMRTELARLTKDMAERGA
jgi:F-type H+-transporting ATPase subunit delta